MTWNGWFGRVRSPWSNESHLSPTLTLLCLQLIHCQMSASHPLPWPSSNSYGHGKYPHVLFAGLIFFLCSLLWFLPFSTCLSLSLSLSHWQTNRTEIIINEGLNASWEYSYQVTIHIVTVTVVGLFEKSCKESNLQYWTPYWTKNSTPAAWTSSTAVVTGWTCIRVYMSMLSVLSRFISISVCCTHSVYVGLSNRWWR